MKRIKAKMNRFALLMCLLMVCVQLSGCGGSEQAGVTGSPVSEETPLPTPKVETITIFTIDPTSMTLLPSRVKKKEDDDSVEYIAQLVADNLDDSEIRVSDAFSEGDKAIVVFDSKHKPMTGCDEEMETLVLDCFSSSILDNVEGCKAVIFRSDKGEYASDHLTLKEDEIYASK